LGEDLGVGGLEGFLGVEGPFAPGRLAAVVLLGDSLVLACVGLSDGCVDHLPGFGVAVEEGARDVGSAGDSGDADLSLLPLEPDDGLAYAFESVRCLAAAGGMRRRGARFGAGAGFMRVPVRGRRRRL
jgi:hypothetical protein